MIINGKWMNEPEIIALISQLTADKKRLERKLEQGEKRGEMIPLTDAEKTERYKQTGHHFDGICSECGADLRKGGKRMNVYLAELPVGDYTYGEDYAMVVIAKDKLHAERKARWSSDNFKQAKKMIISQVSLDTEAVILKANVGG